MFDHTDDGEILLNEVAKAVRAGTTRDDVLRALLQQGIRPEVGQRLFEVATDRVAGEGYFGYWEWLQSGQRQGEGALWIGIILTIPIFLAAIFLTVGIFPAGRYHSLILVLPAALLCAPLFLGVSWAVFAIFAKRPTTDQ